MKFNWGHGIVMVLVLYGGLMIFMVYQSTQQRFDLVTEEYYNTEDSYQERQTRKLRGYKVDGKLNVTRKLEGIEVSLPEGLSSDMIEGTLTFYSPTDKYLDFEVDLIKGEKIQFVDRLDLPGGRWTVKVDIPGDSGFYFEENVFL
jgi:hypothetical protein